MSDPTVLNVPMKQSSHRITFGDSNVFDLLCTVIERCLDVVFSGREFGVKPGTGSGRIDDPLATFILDRDFDVA